MRDSSESLLRGGQVTVIAIITGETVQAYTTEGANEPHCFNDLPAGQYTVSAVAPASYAATTVTSVPLEVGAGSVTTLEFGAQQQTAPSGEPRPPTRGQPAMTGLLLGGGVILIMLVLLAPAGGQPS